MDFKVSECLKMIEDHFGRAWTKPLLFVLYVAIFVAALHVIFWLLFLPLYRAIRYVLSKPSLSDLLSDRAANIATGLTVLAVLFLIQEILHRLHCRRVTRMKEEATGYLEYCLTECKRLSEEKRKLAEGLSEHEVRNEKS